MAAMRFAGMARFYRYPQAGTRDCFQFAARQRGVWTTGDLLRRASTPCTGDPDRTFFLEKLCEW
jgi:hypothetical protein